MIELNSDILFDFFFHSLFINFNQAHTHTLHDNFKIEYVLVYRSEGLWPIFFY
jgi:hypothetical protein